MRTGAKFMLGGFLSVLFVHLWTMAFPYFQDLLFITGVIVEWNITLSADVERAISLFFYCFIQIGLLEESMKALSIRTVEFIRDKKESNIVSIMLYTCISSLGFAAVENVYYFVQAHEMAYIRVFTSVISHMACGVIMGYFFSLGHLRKKRTWYTILGISFASMYHGAYDYLVYSMNEWKTTFHFYKKVVEINPSYYGLILGVVIAYPLYRRIKHLESRCDPVL